MELCKGGDSGGRVVGKLGRISSRHGSAKFPTRTRSRTSRARLLRDLDGGGVSKGYWD